MNEEIIKYIKNELALCDKEIRKADNDIMTATEHRNCYGDRRMMLLDLLNMVQKASEEKENRP